MDLLTHAAAGLSVGECGFRQRIGRAGTWLALSGGVLPDLDALAFWQDPWSLMQHHRHLTHSLLFGPAMGLVLAGLWWRFSRCKRFGLLWACAAATLISHALLDWCTSYGTMLLAPLSDRRFALDWIAIVDPFYSGILLVGLTVCWHRRRRGRACDSWRAALAGLGLSTAYLGLGGVEHGVALRLIAGHARAAKQTVVQAGAYPQIGSVFVWRLVYRTDESFYVARLNSLRARCPRFAGAAIANDPFVRRAEEHPRVQLFRRFAMGMVRPVHRRLDGQDLVVYHDMRYGWPTDSLESMWTVQVWFDAAGRIAKVLRAAGPAAWARHVAPDHRSR